MKNWKTWMVVGLAVALALVGSLTVLADDPVTEMAPRMGRGSQMGRIGAEALWRPDEGAFEQGWAGELGVTVVHMKKAAETAWNKLIDQAVADGDLSEEEAALVRECPAPYSGERGGPGERDHGGLMAEIVTPEEQHAFMADLLGMTPEELQAQLDDGESMRGLIADADLTAEELRKASDAFRADEIAKAVEEGFITEEQAEQLLRRPERPMGGRGQRGPNVVDASSEV